MPILRNIWKYVRNPTPEERGWLTLLEGEFRANRIIIDTNEHRHEMENRARQEKIDKINEIESQVKFMQEELNNYRKTYEFIINRHKSLQHIFEIMFPPFLQRLELHGSVYS